MEKCRLCLQDTPPGQLVVINDLAVCGNCKPRQLQRMQEGVTDRKTTSIMRYPLVIFIKWTIIVYISAIVPLLLSGHYIANLALLTISAIITNWELYLIRKKEPQYDRIMKYSYSIIGIKALTQFFPIIEIILGAVVLTLFNIDPIVPEDYQKGGMAYEIRVFCASLLFGFCISIPCLILGYIIPKYLRRTKSDKII